MTALNSKIHILDLQFLGLSDTIAAFLLVADNGEVALVESGPYSTIESLRLAMAAHGYAFSDISKVFLTHIHFDHAGAAWYLAQQGATIYVHPKGEKHLLNPEKLYNSAKMIYGDQMERLWGEMQNIPTEQLKTVEHGEKIPFGNSDIQAWYTAGHAVHHIAWQWADSLFAGDVAGVRIGETGVPMPPCPPPDIDVEAWDESIELMKNLSIKALYLTHYGIVTEVEKHLNSLSKMLHRWADWIRPHYEAGTPQAVIVPQFQAFIADLLAQHGIVGEQAAQYEGANPSYMSVAGLMRYWKLRLTAPL